MQEIKLPSGGDPSSRSFLVLPRKIRDRDQDGPSPEAQVDRHDEGVGGLSFTTENS
jgi:hypothetical protein